MNWYKRASKRVLIAVHPTWIFDNYAPYSSQDPESTLEKSKTILTNFLNMLQVMMAK